MTTQHLSQIMRNAWKFFRTTGQSFSDCLKLAWTNFKLVQKMEIGIVRFYFQKVDGSIREAWGTLNEKLVPTTTTGSNRAKNETVQTYFDTEKQEFRCFKKLNLVSFNYNNQSI